MPNEELENEVEAINSIYGDGTLVLDSGDVFVLDLPDSRGSLRLNFPPDYPEAPPTILGTQSSGEHKGDADRLLQAFRSTVGRLFISGEVCLFAVVEEFVSPVESHETTASDVLDEASDDVVSSVESTHLVPQAQAQWIISDPVKENTSVFVAHAARVSSVQEAEAFLEHLLATDKKVAKASHNMTAWRIKGENGVTFQDCDDDGESAAGGMCLYSSIFRILYPLSPPVYKFLPSSTTNRV